MPVTVVPTSLATVAIATFMTELSRVIRNWPDARVSRTTPVFCVRPTSVTRGWYPEAGTLDPDYDDEAQGERARERRTHDDRADDVRDDEDLQTQQDRASEPCADVIEHARGVFAACQLDDAANERDET